MTGEAAVRTTSSTLLTALLGVSLSGVAAAQPAVPDGLFPYDGEEFVERQTTFLWDAVPGATSYDFQVALDSGFATVLVDQVAQTATFVELQPAQALGQGVTYYWRVRANDGGGSSAWVIHQLPIARKWVDYVLQVSTDNSFNVVDVETDPLRGATEYTLQPHEALVSGPTQYWQVIATDLAGNVRTSATNNFPLADTFPPSIPEYVFPAADTEIANETPRFNWSDATDPNGVTYTIQVATDAGMQNLLVDQAGAGVSDFQLSQAAPLLRGLRYYWRVGVTDNLGNFAWGPIVGFDVQAASITYQVQIATDAAFTALHTDENSVVGTQFTVPPFTPLLEAVRYYWRVFASDPSGNTQQSNETFELLLADQYPPPLPSLDYPAADAEVINPEITFDWSDSFDTSGFNYRLQVASDAGFANVLVDQQPISSAQSYYTLTPGQFMPPGRYFWRVEVIDTLDNRAFTSPIAVTLVEKTVEYELDVSEDAGFGIIHATQTGIDAEEYTLGSHQLLTEGITYYWRVRGLDLANNITSSTNVFEFTLADNFPPSIPEPVYPPIGEAPINVETTFVWSEAEDGSAVTYTFQLATDSGFTNIIVDADTGAAQNYSLISAEALTRGELYYWRVESRDAFGNAVWGPAWAVRGGDKTIQYDIEVSTDPAFGVPDVSETGLTAAEYDTPSHKELTEGSTYYWRVTSRDPAGNEAVNVSDFQFTLADTFPPSLPEILYPLNNTTVINDLVTFDWSTSDDPNGVSYTLEIATDAGMTNVVQSYPGLADSSHQLLAGSELTRGQLYFWRVNVEDVFGNAQNGSIWQFTVDAKAVEYGIEVSEDVNFSTIHASEQGLTALEYTLQVSEQIVEGRTYYWRVNATDPANNSVDSTSVFELQVADNFPPSLPVPLYPTPNGVSLNDSPTFIWSESFDPNDVTYTFELATDSGFTNILESVVTNTTPNHTTALGLTPGDRYYWRISVEDTLGNSQSTPGVALDIDPRRVTYSLLVATNAGLTAVHAEVQQLQTNEYTLAQAESITEGVTYYWQVQAIDSAANTRLSTSIFELEVADLFGPSLPEPLYPLPGATVLNPEVVFDWGESIDPNGASFTFELATDAGFTNVFISENVGAQSYYELTPAQALTRGTRYFWRVSPFDGLGNVTTGTPIEVNIDAKALEYSFEIAEDQGFATVHASEDGLITDEYQLQQADALTEGRDYWWRVTAEDPASNSVQSTSTFRLNIADNFAPSLPDLIYPANNSVVANPQPTMVWSQSQDPNNVTYELQIATDAGMTNIIVSEPNLATESYSLLVGQALTRGSRYFWRVVVTDDLGNTANGGIWVVEIDPKTVRYDLELAEDNGFSTIHANVLALSAEEYTLQASEEVVDGRTYYWRVHARDAALNQSTSTSVFEFLLADVFPPSIPDALYPLDLATVINPRVPFVWSASQDSNGASYTLEVSSDAGFTNLLVSRAGLASTDYQLDPGEALAGGQRYFWRLRIVDGLGNEVTGPTWTLDVAEKAVAYDLEVAEDAGFATIVLSSDNLDTEEYQTQQVEQLTEGRTYYWRVTGRDLASNATNSTSDFEFTLADDFAPSLPLALYPEPGGTVLNPELTFDWSDAQDPSTPIVYGFQVATDAGFTNLLIDEANVGGSSYTVTPAQALTPGLRYFWRVIVTDSLGNTANAPGWDVTIQAKQVVYDITVAEDAAFTQIAASEAGLTQADYTLDIGQALTEGRTYYWHVSARDPAGNPTQSTSDFEFSLADVYPPSTPLALYPPDNASILNDEPTLHWTESIDPNGVLYTLQLASDAGFQNILVDQAGLGSAGYTLDPAEVLNRGERFFWRVLTADNLGNNGSSAIYSFIVQRKSLEYNFEIAEDAAFTQIHAEQGQLGLNEFVLPAAQQLSEGQTYYWRVTALDLASNPQGSTSVHELTLADNFAPTVPEVLYPPQGENVINPELTFDWTDSVDSSNANYDLEIAADSGFVTVLTSAPGLTVSQFTLSGAQALQRGVTFYWRLRLYDDLGNSAYGPTWTVHVQSNDPTYRFELAEDDAFTLIHAEAESLTNPDFLLPEVQKVTEGTNYWWRVHADDLAGNQTTSTSVFEFSVADVFAPSEPLLLYPEDGSTILNDRVTFDWSTSTDPNGVSYQIQVAGDSGFVNILVDEDTLAPSFYTLPSLQALQRDRLYYWRIGVEDTLGNFAWGPIWSVNIADKSLLYNLAIAEDAAFTQIHAETADLTAAEYLLENREEVVDGVHYWWRVEARDLAGNLTASTSTFEFELADVYPPTEPLAVFPEMDGVTLNDELTFVWTEAQDSSTVEYAIEVATDPGFSNVVIDQTGLATPQYQVQQAQALVRGLTYHWRVRVTDGLGNTSLGPVWTFDLVDRTVEYRFELASDNTFTVVEIDETSINSEEFTPSIAQQLTEGLTYWWRVTGTDLAGNATNSTSEFELTLADLYAPPFPAALYPEDGASLANAQVTFDWSDVFDPNNVRYGIEVATDVGFTNVLVSEANLNSSFYGLSVPQTLNRDDTYYWRLNVSDDLGNAANGPVWSFDVQAKSTEYSLVIAEDAAFTQIHVDRDGIDAQEYTLEPFEEVLDGRTYYWRVTGRDLAGNTMDSTSTFEFQLQDVFAPSLPAPIYPTDAATVLNAQSSFVWTQGFDDNGVAYRFQLASDSGFVNVLVDESNLADPNYTLQVAETLIRGNLYYWRVEVEDTLGNRAWSPAWSVTVDSKLVEYTWEIAEDAGFATVHAAVDDLNGEEYILQPFQGLTEGTTYHWRVFADDPAGNRQTATSVFELMLADIYPPSLPDVEYPPQSSTIINPEVTFDWTEGQDPSGVEYTVQVSEDAVFANVLFERTGLVPSAYTLAPGEALARGGLYYWRVEVRDSLGNFQWSPTWQFNVDDKEVIYNLQVAEDMGFANIHADVPQLALEEYTLATAEEVADGIQYYWRVIAEDEAGQSRASTSIYSFSLTDVYPPPHPLPLYPRLAESVVNPAVTFDWTSVQDSNNVTYGLQVATDDQFTNIVVDQQNLTNSFHTLTAGQEPPRGVTYWWRVRVVDDLGNEDFTAGWEFTLRDKEVQYALDIATDAGFGLVVVDKDQLTTEEYTLITSEGLTEGVQYYWHVTATDIAGNTLVSTSDFRLQLADSFAPGEPELLYPLVDANLANDEVSFDWSEAQDPSGPVTYTLYIATDDMFANTIFTQAGIQATSWTLGQNDALARGGEYFWRVAAEDALNNTVSTAGQRFLVREKGSTYRLEIATDVGFGVTHMDRSSLADEEYTLEPFEELSEGVTYYWRVTAVDLAQNSQLSNGVFELQLADSFAPSEPVHLYPTKSSSVSNPTVTFVWATSTDPAGAVTYRLEVSDVADFSNLVVDSTQMTTQYTAALNRDQIYFWRVTATDPLGNSIRTAPFGLFVSPKELRYDYELSLDPAFATFVMERPGLDQLEYNTQPYEALDDSQTYHWRVRAYDVAGNATLAGPFEFTLVDMYPPGLPDLIYPMDNAAVINPRVAFDWSETTDSSGVVTYGIQIATDDQFANIVEQQSGLTATAYQPVATLARSSRYWWRVQVTDGPGNSDFTPSRIVEVQPKIRYFLEVSEDQTFSTLYYSQRDLPTPEHTLLSTAAVTVGTTYYWRITGSDGANNSVQSTSTFEFTVDVPSLVNATVTPFSQPERADFAFEASRPVDWTLELRERVSGICGRLVHRTTDSNLTTISGTWPGLSPGAEYCWNALAMDGTGMIGDNGIISLAPLPTFVANPTYTKSGIEVDVEAEITVGGVGTIEYNEGVCGTGNYTGLSFDGGDLVNIPGNIITRDAFSIEGWVNLDSAGQTADMFLTELPWVRVSLEAGALRLQMNTDNGNADFTTSAPVPDSQWSHVAVVYDGAAVRLYIDAQNLGGGPWTGNVLSGGPGFFIGNFANAFAGDLTSVAVHRRGLSGTEVGNHFLAGAFANGGELPDLANTADTIARWYFSEATDVQSIYDDNGLHHAGVLGANHLAEAFDPTRTTFANSNVMNGGMATTDLSGRATMMPGGPDYCGRVIVQTNVGWIASQPLDTFDRNTDLADPTVTLNHLNVIAECTGNRQRTMRRDFEPDPPIAPPVGHPDGIGTPDVMDDVTAPGDLIVVAHLDTQMGPVMNVTHSFDVGDTSVYWSAQDEAGNVGWAMNGMNLQPQTIRVVDTTLPAVTGGAEVVVEATDPNGTPYTPQPDSATDICGTVMVDHAPQGPYALGSRTVTFTVTDEEGLEGSATRVITIVDTTAPVFDPPLDTLTVAHDGSLCFEFTPPNPAITDNGYPLAQLNIGGLRLGNPPDNCWAVGTHTYEWTISDPEGNTRVETQTIEITMGTLLVSAPTLEVAGVPTPTFGRYYNNNVTVVFTVGNGMAPYQVTITPAPDSIMSNVNGNVETFFATYSTPGAYATLLLAAQDQAGMGPNFGSRVVPEGFGIDVTAPTISADIVEFAANYVLGDSTTYPFLFMGESLPINQVHVQDAEREAENLATAMAFDGVDDYVEVPPTAALEPNPPDTAVTLQTWFRVQSMQEAPLVTKDSGIGVVQYGLTIDAQGRVNFIMTKADFSVVILTGGQIVERKWHHVAATFDGQVARLYVDGEPADWGVTPGPILAGNGPLRMGGYLIGSPFAAYLDGELADVALFDEALDAETIRGYHKGGSGDPVQATAPGLVGLWPFRGIAQDVVDETRNSAGTLGANNAVGADDPTRLQLTHPTDSTSSGLVTVVVKLVNTANMNESNMVSFNVNPTGTPLRVGDREMFGEDCNGPVSGACTPGESSLRGELISAWNSNQADGTFEIQIEATDAAGNTASQALGLVTTDYAGALDWSLTAIRDQLNDPGAVLFCQQCVEDAELDTEVAHSYWTQSSYPDGSFLRAERAVVSVLDAEDQGDDFGPLSSYIARAMLGEFRIYIGNIGTNLDASDQPIYADGEINLVNAGFEQAVGSSADIIVTLIRDGFDSVAVLYPAYQNMRSRLRAVRARWEFMLEQYNNTSIDEEPLRIDTVRLIAVQQMMTASRDMLREVIWREVDSALNNPFTTQVGPLESIKDVIEKDDPNDPDEEADLLRVNNPMVNDACLDLLAGLQLTDDRRFALCYLRLNDLAADLENVQESEVHTKRWRAGLTIVLFNMLELSMFMSPTGLPFVVEPGPPMEVVLPDGLQLQYPRATPVSAIPANTELVNAYTAYYQAQAFLEQGDADAAFFQVFLPQRCILVGLYNQYYSMLNVDPTPTVADPREAPLAPMDVGCVP